MDWIKCFLENRTQKVAVNKCYSNTSNVLSGVPHGSVLGPVLFVIFVADIPELVKSFINLFADDTKIYSNTEVETTAEEGSTMLQKDLSYLKEWTTEMQMGFNMSKCHILHLGNNNPQTNYYLPIQTNNNTGKDGISYDLKFHELKKVYVELDLGDNRWITN